MSDKVCIDPEEFEKKLMELIKKREDWEKKRLENVNYHRSKNGGFPAQRRG